MIIRFYIGLFLIFFSYILYIWIRFYHYNKILIKIDKNKIFLELINSVHSLWLVFYHKNEVLVINP